MAVYGVASIFLGVLGTSVGWALFQIFMIMTANTSGMITGEWRHTAPETRRLFWVGFGLLALATLIISMGNASPKTEDRQETRAHQPVSVSHTAERGRL